MLKQVFWIPSLIGYESAPHFGPPTRTILTDNIRGRYSRTKLVDNIRGQNSWSQLVESEQLAENVQLAEKCPNDPIAPKWPD